MRRSALVLAVFAATPLALAAQTPYSECNQTLIVASQQNINLCNAALDGVEVFQPVAGLLVSGGNPVLGGIGTLGGFFHLSLTARVNATELRTPDLSYNGTGTTVAQGDKIFAPAPLIEGAFGLFNGVGPSGFLAIDLLGSAQLLPTTQVKNLSVASDARKIGSVALGLGYGARVGILKGHSIVPSVTVSAMHRSIPRLSYGNVSGSDQYSFSTDLGATNLRAVAGYKLAILAVGAGLGWDKYTSSVSVDFANQTVPGTSLNVKKDLDNSRTLAFLTAALDLPIIKIGAEVGYQLGKTENLKTTFTGNDPSQNRLFAGGGVRFSF